MKKPKTKKQLRNKRVRTNKYSGWLKVGRFLPTVAITLFASFLLLQPYLSAKANGSGVLAYATNTSTSGLLSATNAQRSANGVAALSLNAKLNSAAQAKANDMVARDYWSHQTPDGQEPWVFFNNAGYDYLAAGENLAYGFSSSSTTIDGWMGSPPHKANLLSTTFLEVGFGIANSPNFVGKGPQTVVVAEYGKPQGAVLPETTQPAPKPTTPPASTPKKAAVQPAAPVQQPKQVEQTQPVTKTENNKEEKKTEPVATTTSNQKPPESGSIEVNQAGLLTGGALWSTGLVLAVAGLSVLLWIVHKGLKIHNWLKASEKFVFKHIHLDLTVLSIVYLAIVLLKAAGQVH